MNLTVNYVPHHLCAQTWPKVEGFIAEAMKHGFGDYTLEQAKLLVNMGSWLLLVAVDDQGVIHGAATVSFLNNPNHRSAFITFIGGRLISNKETFKQMCDILKANGATRVQGMARPSIARLWKRYGFYERTTLVETML